MMTRTRTESKLEPDYQETENFLHLLDPDARTWNFMGFNDDKRSGASKQPRKISGSLEKCWDELVSWNRNRYSVCVMLNRSRRGKLGKNDITRIRTVWREVDDEGSPKLIIPPSIVVSSSKPAHKKHEYYLIEDTMSRYEAEAIQDALVNLGGDAGSKDIAHKMRLPGFYHQKYNPADGLNGEPYLVRITGGTNEIHTTKKLLSTFVPEGVGRGVLEVDEELDTDNINGIAERISPWRDPIMVMRIKHYLSFADPNCLRKKWIKAGMAVHMQSHYDQEGNGYFKLWHAWSKKSDSFKDLEDDKIRWKSFSKGRVGLGSLIQLAEANENYHSPHPKEYLEAINEHLALIEVAGKIKVVFNWNRPKDVMVIGRDDAKALLSPHAWANGQGQVVEPLHFWQSSGSARLVKGLKYMPDKPPGISEGYVNTYHGDGNENLARDKKGSCADYLEHIRENICGGRRIVYEWILDWMAHMIQHPGVKPSVAIVLRGDEGVGKGVFAQGVRGIVGDDNFSQFTSADQLMNRFNAHIHENICVFADEVIWGGDKRHRGILYSLISEPRITVERKFMSPMSMSSCVRLIIATNESWAVPTTLSARRFLMLDVLNDRKEDIEYFTRIMEQLAQGGYAELYDMLKERKIASSLSSCPDTDEIVEQKLLSLSSLHSWWTECVNERKILGHYEGDDGWPETIVTSDFWDAYARWCKDQGLRRAGSTTKVLMSQLKNILPHCERLRRVRKRKLNANVYVLEAHESYQDALTELRLI